MDESGSTDADAPDVVQIDPTQIPPGAIATPDLICWIWAAVPPKNGKINVRRAARAFHVSETTMRRWLNNADEYQLSRAGIIRAKQLAILRSKGHLLWPGLDIVSQARAQAAYRNAQQAVQLLSNPRRVPPTWKTNGTLEPHDILLIHWPRAHAYTVTVTRTRKTITRIVSSGGVIIQTARADNLYAAELIKHRTLASQAEHRCVAPRTLIPIGRTEAWREHLGAPRLILHTDPELPVMV